METTKTSWLLTSLVAGLIVIAYCCLISWVSNTFWRVTLILAAGTTVYLIPRNPAFYRRRIIVALSYSAALTPVSPVLRYSLPENLAAQFGSLVFSLSEVHPVTVLFLVVLSLVLSWMEHREKMAVVGGASTQGTVLPNATETAAAPVDNTIVSPTNAAAESESRWSRVCHWWPVGLAVIAGLVAVIWHFTWVTNELPPHRALALEKLGATVTSGDALCEISFRDSTISDLADVTKLLTTDRQAFRITLTLSNCHELVDLSPLLAARLYQLNLINCHQIEVLWSLDEEPTKRHVLDGSLTKLTVHNCDLLQSCSGLAHFEKLSLLSIRRCNGFQQLGISKTDGKQPLSSLTELDITGSAVADLDSWPTMKQIETVRLQDCENLSSLVGLRRQVSLKRVDLSGCTGLMTLDGLPDSELHAIVIQKMSSSLDVSVLKTTKIGEIHCDSTTEEKIRELQIEPAPRLTGSPPLW